MIYFIVGVVIRIYSFHLNCQIYEYRVFIVFPYYLLVSADSLTLIFNFVGLARGFFMWIFFLFKEPALSFGAFFTMVILFSVSLNFAFIFIPFLLLASQFIFLFIPWILEGRNFSCFCSFLFLLS